MSKPCVFSHRSVNCESCQIVNQLPPARSTSPIQFHHILIRIFLLYPAILKQYIFRAPCNILSVTIMLTLREMGRHLQKTCGICLKTMRSDHLTRHMRHHEKKPYSIQTGGITRQTDGFTH